MGNPILHKDTKPLRGHKGHKEDINSFFVSFVFNVGLLAGLFLSIARYFKIFHIFNSKLW